MRANLPSVLAGSIVVAALAVGATFLFSPVYSATTVLTLDGELARVLKGVTDGYPSLTAADYIRYEYFASHSLNLMQAPAIAARIISDRKLQARGGGVLFEGHLVNPGLPTLLFNNRGYGVRVKWIPDTQQFAISGMSRNPDEAAALSREYVNLFLEQNRTQYAEICVALAARFSSRVEHLENDIAAVGRSIEQVREKAKSIDLSEEAVQIAHRIEAIRQELDADELSEGTYAARLEEIEMQAARYAELAPYERTVEANPRLKSLLTELQRLAQEEAAAAVEYTPEHPIVARLRAQMVTVRAAMKDETERSFASETHRLPATLETVLSTLLDLRMEHLVFKSRADHYTRLLDRYLSRQREITTATRELTPLTEKLDSLILVRTQALGELTTVQALADHTLPFFRVVSPAVINPGALKEFRYFPKRRELALASLFGAFFVLGFLAIARELWRDRFFGAPQLDGVDGSPRIVDGGSLPALMEEPEATRYRFIRQACLELRDDPLVFVTSLTRGEGRQATARVLAWSHAQAGRSVLLIDADDVSRSLTKALGLEGRPGVQDVLTQNRPVDEVVVRDALPGVAVLPTGGGSLSGREFARLLDQAARSWERVVVVTPPEADDAAFGDALPSHRELVVVAWGRHGRDAVARIVRAAAGPDRVPVLVVTQIPSLPDPTTIRGLFGLSWQTARAGVGWLGAWRRE